MRIQGPASANATPTRGVARRGASGGFSVSEQEENRPAKGPAALRTVGGIDALIALQGVEDPTERRRQAVKRGRIALDALDELKLGLLSGTLNQSTLARLRAAAGLLKDGTGETRLDGVLAEIELRVEVEIAKMAGR